MRVPTGVLSIVLALAGCAGPPERPEDGGAPVVAEASYRGWRSLRLSNGLIELHVVPEIGGRVMQFRLGEKEFLWVNSRLEGALPPPGGLGSDGAWLNYGGDKLWPAPQGWDDETQWPGPPDAVLDGSPYRVEVGREDASIRLESGDDPRSGIGFSRVIRMQEGAARVTFDATMRNVDTKPRRWGIWAHTQLDGAKAGGSGHNALLGAWCPMNPRSRFQEGYSVIFGEKDNPSFEPDRERNLLRVRYKYLVGKVGLDSPAGWTATVDGATGHVFVQRFVFEADREYPDGSSVEFWLNGRGTIHAYKKEMVMADDPVENPCVFESEVLSPFARLLPGESFTWRYEWCATNIGGDFPVVDCSDAGVTSEPLTAIGSGGKLSLRGRFGVFSPGTVRAAILDGGGRELRSVDLEREASPLRPLAIEATTELPVGTAAVALVLQDLAGNDLGRLARADIERRER